MGEFTSIEWAESSINIWLGCQETGSEACRGCYARALVEDRFKLAKWGPHEKRVETKGWRSQLRKISRLALAAFAAGRKEPWFVFVNSLSDFWDNQADPKLRAEAMAAFREHPHLTFLLLTKRPQNIVKMFAEVMRITAEEYGPLKACWPRNVAIGFTAVTQKEMDRDSVHALAAYRALNPAFLFWSGEPLVGPVRVSEDLLALGGRLWAIVGGGTNQGKWKAPPTPPAWFREVRDQCAPAGVPFMLKQNGEFAPPQTDEDRQAIKDGRGYWGSLGEDGNFHDRGNSVVRMGKKRAGRMLDGRTHDARPEVRT